MSKKYIGLYDFHHDTGVAVRAITASDCWDDALVEAEEEVQRDGHLNKLLALLTEKEAESLALDILAGREVQVHG